MKKLKFTEDLFYNVNTLSRTITRIADEEFFRHGLSLSHAILLLIVNNKPGINPTEISREMQLMPSTVTRLIDKLIIKGFLSRKQKGREMEIFPEKNCSKICGEITAVLSVLEKNLTKKLGASNKKKLVADLKNINNLLQKP